MTEPMTSAELEEIKQAEQAATRGPWRIDKNDSRPMPFHYVRHEGQGWPIASMWKHREPRGVDDADATFIALSRTAVPHLLSEVARLQSELDAAEKLIRASNAHEKMLREKYRETHPIFAAVLDENEALTTKLDAAEKRAEAAIADLNAQGTCITCKNDPHNGGTCPGFIDCHNPDSPMAEFYRQEWRGPCADNTKGAAHADHDH